MIFSYDSATYFINKNWLVGYYLGFLTFLMGLYFRGGQNRERGTASRKALYLAFMKCYAYGNSPTRCSGDRRERTPVTVDDIGV